MTDIINRFYWDLSDLSHPAAAAFHGPLFHVEWITSLYLVCLNVTTRLSPIVKLWAKWTCFPCGTLLKMTALCFVAAEMDFSVEITDGATVMRAIHLMMQLCMQCIWICKDTPKRVWKRWKKRKEKQQLRLISQNENSILSISHPNQKILWFVLCFCAWRDILSFENINIEP